MATTTNYGWATPDDTSLVKDGASAIRTLGSSIDTTTKNLNPETTLGDIVYRSSTANVKTRLGIGSTGQVLTVASGVPAWATPSGGSGGMTLLSTTTLSGSSTTISSISGSYTNLYIVLKNVITNASDIQIYGRFNGDTAANYTWIGTGARLSDAVVSSVSKNNNYFFCGQSNGTSGILSAGQSVINIPRYAATEARFFTAQTYGSNDSLDSNRLAFFVNQLYADTTAISSITFLTSSSSFNSGTVYIYGV